MKIIIRDRNQPFIDAFKNYDYSKNVELQCCQIFEDDNWNAIVSPANSFGFMNGGIDQIYINRFGQQLEDKVRKDIKEWWDGELLVGQAMAIPIYVNPDAPDQKYLIVAPTMRVPQRIIEPVDVYLATKAAVRCALTHDINTLVIPGMGTGVGMVNYKTAAKNMLIGIRDAIEGMKPFNTCAEAWLDSEKFK